MHSHSNQNQQHREDEGTGFFLRNSDGARERPNRKSLDLKFRDAKGGYSLRFNYGSLRARAHV